MKNNRYGIFPGVEDIHLSDLGEPSDPIEAPAENGSDQGKQKDVTEVAPKDHSNQGIQTDVTKAPMKNLDEDFAVRMSIKL
jgi:hypothetical protein